MKYVIFIFSKKQLQIFFEKIFYFLDNNIKNKNLTEKLKNEKN